MSKNIVIQEGGIGKQITADKLKTNLVGGGSCLWVPEDSYNLTAKQITEDGTYVAANEGYYGYSQVTVNGIGSVTGKGEGGNEYNVTTDEDGNIVSTLMPSSIHIDTLPLKIAYVNGEVINITGMVVKAYDANGDIWTGDGEYPNGIIPHSELSVSDYQADLSKAEQYRIATAGVVNPYYMWPLELNVPYENQGTWHNPYTGQDEPIYRYFYELEATMPVYLVWGPFDSGYTCMLVSMAPFTALSQRSAPGGWSPQTREHTGTLTRFGVYYAYIADANFVYTTAPDFVWPACANQDDVNGRVNAAILAINNGHPSDEDYGVQPITVYWERPDGKALSDSYDITVTAEGE